MQPLAAFAYSSQNPWAAFQITWFVFHKSCVRLPFAGLKL
jgi:hypothetical protein